MEGCSPALNCCGGGGLEPKVLVKQATKQGYIECEVGGVADLSFPNSKTRRGRVQESGQTSPTLTAGQTEICRIESHLEYKGEIEKADGIYTNASPEFQRGPLENLSRCLKANNHDAAAVISQKNNIRIRKLTPKECFRLMGFKDKHHNAAKEAGVSNSQLYKQAGNSIVVDVLYYILAELYNVMPYLFEDLRLSSFFTGIGAFELALERLFESIKTGNFTKPQAEGWDCWGNEL